MIKLFININRINRFIFKPSCDYFYNKKYIVQIDKETMSVSITLTDVHPVAIRQAVAGTSLENDMEFERVLMGYMRPHMMMRRPMPNVSQASFVINLVYKNNPVSVTITGPQR